MFVVLHFRIQMTETICVAACAYVLIYRAYDLGLDSARMAAWAGAKYVSRWCFSNAAELKLQTCFVSCVAANYVRPTDRVSHLYSL